MDVLPIQNIYQGSRERRSAFEKEVGGGPKEISVFLRVVCLFGFVFARVFYAFVVVVFFTSSFSGRRRFLKVAGSDRRTDRLILARPRVNCTSSTDRQEEDNFASKWFLFRRSIVS